MAIPGYILTGTGLDRDLLPAEFYAGSFADVQDEITDRISAIASARRPLRFWIGQGSADEERAYPRATLSPAAAGEREATELELSYILAGVWDGVKIERFALPAAEVEFGALLAEAFQGGSAAVSFEIS